MKLRLSRWLSSSMLVAAIGCSDGGDPSDPQDTTLDTFPTDRDKSPTNPVDPTVTGNTTPPPVSMAVPGNPQVPVSKVLASLSAAANCEDLLTRVQDDAIAKLMMQVELAKKRPPGTFPERGGPVFLDGSTVSRPAVDEEASATPNAAPPPTRDAASGGKGESAGDASGGPVSASGTNVQVAGVDEADFVKVVEKGAYIYLLHGNTLRKLDSWPPEQTALVGKPFTIEGTPSEMFITDQGKAVVFSSVYSYQSTGGKPAPGAPLVDLPVADICAPGYCGGYGSLKITVVDVSTDEPKVEREIFYPGSYVSSRRYEQVVRAVIQSYSKFSGLFTPQIQWYDAWNRPYDAEEIASQLDEWLQRTTKTIRGTELSDWFPVAQQVVDGKLVDIAPGCDSYFVPDPGLTDSGLTHVLSLDTSSPTSPIGGVTVVGSVSTVYSNQDALVLAQPDYRWSPVGDFALLDQQQTAFHVFTLRGATTSYDASGWLFGTLPSHNPQFGIDIAGDGTLRVAATGWVRDQPAAQPSEPQFWARHPENRVLTAKVADGKVAQVGQSDKLGHEGETIQSSRFVGDRAYVVTFRQTDPLIVLDVSAAAAPKVLGEIEIPGFSQYVHPLDATHLVTVGQDAQFGVQLQLFDVTDPTKIPEPAKLPLGSSSEVSWNHKAFTSFEGGLLAVPAYGQYANARRYGSYQSFLKVVRATPEKGLEPVADIDHGRLYANNGAGVSCGRCDLDGCYDYRCGYAPELRRGHFVKGEDGTVYVYSFSYAGVRVDALSPKREVASVGLPQPVYDGQPWYPPPVPVNGGVAVLDGGVAVSPPPPSDGPRMESGSASER